MRDPFAEHEDSAEPSDEELADRAKAGDRGALEELVLRHEPWVHNIVLRMVWEEDQARDLTQDILIRMVTGLPGFRAESRLRTWLYRIAINRVFTHRQQRADEPVVSFAEFARDLDETPDLEPVDPHDTETQLLIEEAKILCTVAMLLCLDGRQRLVFTLGEVFGVGDKVGAEVAGVSAANFRQLLSRARRDLYSFMAGKCGLVETSNPCRCSRKMRGFVERGYMTVDRLRFAEGHRLRVHQVAPSRANELAAADERLHAALFQEHPFLDTQRRSEVVRRVLDQVQLEP